jgi:hypothetical protein
MGLKEERNKDLLEAYDRTLAKMGVHARYMSRKALIDLTISSPAKRFYVTVEEAAKRINNIERTGIAGVGCKRVKMQKQYEAIYRNYLRLSTQYKGYRKLDIISMALDLPAECFYLELEGACVLFWNLSNGKKKTQRK